MIDGRTWTEFRSTGLLWWTNRMLHLFGWTIVLEIDENGAVCGAYPARCKFRGFSAEKEDTGFQRLTAYMAEVAGPDLLPETFLPSDDVQEEQMKSSPENQQGTPND